MKKVQVTAMNKIRKAIPLIENKFNIKIHPQKGYVKLDGSEVNEFVTEKMIRAIDFGFDPEDALLLRNETFVLEFVNIKEHTHRNNLTDIRSRVIGTGGKAKKTIENLTGAVIAINANQVGIIADSEHIVQTIQGIVSLIQGSKHGNVFAYLEKQNATLRKVDAEDLGLKDPKKDLKNLE